jgi:hypothetical protein
MRLTEKITEINYLYELIKKAWNKKQLFLARNPNFYHRNESTTLHLAPGYAMVIRFLLMYIDVQSIPSDHKTTLKFEYVSISPRDVCDILEEVEYFLKVTQESSDQ